MTEKFIGLQRSTVALLATLLLSVSVYCGAQDQPNPGPPLPGVDRQQSSDEAAWAAKQQKDLAKKYNLQRQEDIKKDTNKLLELATELKQSVDKSNEQMLSLDVIKKADQIEKLAKTVKEKMKGP
jgi:hypothetical protein